MSLGIARRGARAASRRRSGYTPPPVTAGLVSHLIAGQGLTVDGSNLVSAWADQSGAGNGAVQAAAANQPVAGVDVLGRPVVKFLSDATVNTNDDQMDLAPAFTFSARSVSFFAACRVYKGSNSETFRLNNYSLNSPHLRYSFTGASQNDVPQTLHCTSINSGITAHMNPTVLSTVNSTTTVLGDGPELSGALGAVTADTDCLGALLSRRQATDVYEVLVYSAPLSSTDAASVRSYLAAKYDTRTTAWDKNVVFEGDSITQGTGTIMNRGYPSLVERAGITDWRMTNLGSSGATLTTLTSRAGAVDGHKRAGISRNVLMVLVGRNDVAVGGATAAAIYSSLITYVQARVTAGWEVWTGTVISTSANYQTMINELNGLIRGAGNGGSGNGIVTDAGANRVIDFAALPQFDPGSESDTTYYQGDSTHPTQAGAQLLANAVAAQLS